jgi:hypothetical protein
MKKLQNPPLTSEQMFALLDEFYRRGVTKKQMKDIVDIWWKVSDALGKIKS